MITQYQRGVLLSKLASHRIVIEGFIKLLNHPKSDAKVTDIENVLTELSNFLDWILNEYQPSVDDLPIREEREPPPAL